MDLCTMMSQLDINGSSPSVNTTAQFITCSTPVLASLPADGKWMMFFSMSYLDEKWKEAKALYLSGALTGINKICVSTRLSNPKSGVIKFYCGPSDNERLTKLFGNNLLNQMPFLSSTGYMYYKTEAQTLLGRRRKNWTYRIKCKLSK